MKTKNILKKMVAVGTGLVMVGATVMGASAQTLADYPKPFVKDDGTPQSNLALVVGDEAAASDVVGLGDIMGALQQAAVSPVSEAAEGVDAETQLSGDFAEFGRSADLLELGEELNDVRDTLTQGDADALASGTVSTDSGTTDYDQYLNFDTDSADNGVVTFDEDEEDRVGIFLHWDNDAPIFEWEVIFDQGLESDIDDTSDADDLEGENFNVLGSSMQIVDATVDSTTSMELEFMTGAARLTMGEGDTKTVTIDDKEYTVEIVAISETSNDGDGSVILSVNGENTKELDDGDTDRLSDGTQIGIQDIVPTGKETQKSIVRMYLGAYKIDIEDSSFTTDGSGGRLEVNNEFIEDANVDISASYDDSDGDGDVDEGEDITVNDWSVELEADAAQGSDLFVPPAKAPVADDKTTSIQYPFGEGKNGVRQYLDEPQGMMLPGWDIKFHSLKKTGTSPVSLSSSGDDEYRLKFTTQENIKYSIDYLTAESDPEIAHGFVTGDDDDRLHWQEPEPAGSTTGGTAATANLSNTGTSNDFVIPEDDYFVVSDCTTSDNTCESHVLRYDNFDDDNNELTFSDLAGKSHEVTYDLVDDAGSGSASADADFGFTDNFVVGGNTHDVWVSTNGTSGTVDNEGNILVDLNADGDIGADDEAIVGVKGFGLLSLGEYCNADGSAATEAAGAFDSDGDGLIDDLDNTSSTNPDDCGVISTNTNTSNSSDTGQQEYNASIFPDVDGDGAWDNYLGIATLGREFDEGQPEGADSGEDQVIYARVVGRSSDEVGITEITTDLDDDVNDTIMSPFAEPNDDNTGVLIGPESPDDDDDLDIRWDVYGAEWRLMDESGSDEAEDLDVMYPQSQRGAKVVVEFSELTEQTVGVGGKMNPLPVGASKLASEIGDIANYNAIVVGGACANAVAADLQNNPEPCYESIPENRALVKLYEHDNGNMALLVAGRTALNTRQASRALSTGDITQAGEVKEALVSGSSLTEISVSAT